MNTSDRFIIALIYAVAGIILGLGITLFCSSQGLHFSASSIMLTTIFLCFLFGYLFPNVFPTCFKWLWKLFLH